MHIYDKKYKVGSEIGNISANVNQFLSLPGMLPVIFLEFLPVILFFASPSKAEVTRQSDGHDGPGHDGSLLRPWA